MVEPFDGFQPKPQMEVAAASGPHGAIREAIIAWNYLPRALNTSRSTSPFYEISSSRR